MHKRVVVIVISSLLILVATASYLLVWHGKENDKIPNNDKLSSIEENVYQPLIDIEEAYKKLENGDTDAAVEQALKTAESAKDDLDILLAAADIVAVKDKDRAKTLYTEALDLYVAFNNSERDNRPARVYWATASLADQAGECGLAAGYYKKAIQAANKDDIEDQYIVTDSQNELERLKCAG